MIELVLYHTWHKVKGRYQSAFRCAFVKSGTKWLHVVAMDANVQGGMTVWKVPMTDKRYMRPLLLRGKPYPVARAVKIFRKLGKSHGISKGAKKLLREVGTQHKTGQNA